MAGGLTVLKIGGSLLEQEHFRALIRDLAPFLRKNKSVVVHGGGKEITAWAEKLGIPSRFVNGRRFTDDKLMELVEMVLCGKVNPHIVATLNRFGVAALGLSGRDGDLIRAVPVKGLGRVGLPSKIKTGAIVKFIAQGLVPIFASVASASDGSALNINADEMASALACALKVDRLVLFTDVPGILDQDKKTILQLSPKTAEALIKSGVISGGMIPKVRSAFAALKKGVREIWVLQGKLPLQKAQGTLISLQPKSSRHPFQ